MATYRLAQIVITSPVDAAFSVNDQLIVMWDDVTDNFSLTKNGIAFTTAGSLLGELDVNYRIIIGVSSTSDGYAVAGYSFCDGTSLNWFQMPTFFPEYPFFQKVITPNSPVCATGGSGAVCDIAFSGPPTIVHATDLTTGGSITALATSSNGTVKYGLRNSAYTDLTNTTGIFSSLAPGNWVLYAKDTNDCTAIINFRILFKPTEAEHYRFTWDSVQIGSGTSRESRLRIYEREYVGVMVEIANGASSPFTLNKPKQGEINDKFFPIHPTNATLSLIAAQNYQFLPLFTQDNKKYRCVYEVDEGAGFVPVWQGFVVPSTYREDFISTPYVVEIAIGDNVRTLQDELFTDDEGNLLFGSLKLIKVIAHIMKKTGLELSIRSGINIFEDAHNTAATDDPLDQTYIDVSCYREGTDPFTCWDVLAAILKPFGARIFQYNNVWIIEEIDRAVATYAYRLFDSSGVYVSNSTFNPVIDVKAASLTNRAAFKDRDHSLEVVPAYGNITLTSKLNYIGSIVAGGFEKEDLLSPASETFSVQQGVYTSEEGFRDWTLRLNGTSGVSFGRVIVSNRGDSSRTGLKTKDDEDPTRSVGAFYFSPSAWSGNLRDAYLESSVKDYEYGPGDELKFYFEYSTPARPEYEFMVLRLMIKVGSNYLQPDLSWSASESIYRSYPAISNSLQKFELSIPVPTTDVVVDSTVQVRVYYYASSFFDYGLPSATGTPADGTDGVAGLKALVTTSINYDYQADLRHELTFGVVDVFYRGFYKLIYSTAAEDIPNGIVRPTDFNSSTNPKVWYESKTVQLNEDREIRARGTDLKFYVDNIALDALINGQPPVEEDIISLTVSKYINENLEVELYNFDLPAITNGKNMYNNYFRLSDGTPTALWTRSGIAESLTLQQILLKVLGSNHSAPTFRLTGSFINEFARIGINNYLRITKSGSSLSLSNTTFTTNLTGWTQSVVGEAWTWTADNGGSTEVTLIGAEDSKKIYQTVSHSGGYITIDVNINATPAGTSNSEDVLWVLFYNGDDIVHTEKLKTFTALTSESLYEFEYTAFAPGQITRIGFYIQRVTGTSEVNYQVGEFTPDGRDIEEVYQIADYQQTERDNTYFFELMQISKTYISLAGIDTGGNNQGGSTTGREHSSAYSSAYS